MKINVKGLIALISLLLTALGITLLPFFSSTTTTIYAVEDADTCSTVPNYNYGKLSTAQVGADPSENWYRYFFMKFDLSSIPEFAQITDIKLNTYCVSDAAGYYEVTRALSNVWTETSITWNNQPSLAAGSPHSMLIDTTGFKQWNLKFYSSYATEQLKTDKKITFVLVPDRDVPTQYTWTNWRTREYGGGFAPNIVVTYTVPTYTLTVSVKDADGNAIKGATVTEPFSATTDASGLASASLSAGTYTVKVTYNDLTYAQTVTLDASKTVSITIPVYTLTVKVIDPQGNPVSGAIILTPFSGSTGVAGTSSKRIAAGKYTVTVGKDDWRASESVTLTSDKTVTLTITVEYGLQVKVLDQCGNGLPARVKIDEKIVTCDERGIPPAVMVPSGTVTVYAEVQVGEKKFDTSETITVTEYMTKEIIITRRFYWEFFIKYSDGTLATGTLTASSPKETLEIPITNGVGGAYLTDTTYVFAFKASPQIVLETVTVTNDGIFEATIDKEAMIVTTTETSESPITTTPPEVPWVLIPSIYIYSLLGVLVLGFIIAAIVRMRRPS